MSAAMYEQYFGLKEAPFSIAPNPRYLFMGSQYQEALAHLGYGMRGEGGIVVLTGEVGTGKTTICRRLLEEIPEQIKIAYIINPRLSVIELLATICDELGIRYPARSRSIKTYTDLINLFLLKAHAEGAQTVLMIDEAQNLTPDVLEQLRLLTNLETSERKLLQIILLGQPELNALLQRQDLRQLTQRITARYHLQALNSTECKNYIRHRLRVAGCDTPPFSAGAYRAVFNHSGGIPRMINLICDRALLGAYAHERTTVDRATVRQSAAEISGNRRKKISLPYRFIPAATATGLLIASLFYFAAPTPDAARETPVAAVISSPPEATAPVAQQTEPTTVVAQEPVAAPAPETPAPGAIAWPKYNGPATEQRLAIVRLQQLWGDSPTLPNVNGDLCEAVQQQGFQCVRMNNGFGGMRTTGLPAMISLLDTDDRKRHAVLLKLGGEKARLALNGATLELSLDELSRRWLGDYTLLWKMPPGYAGPLRPGVSGPAVGWLVEQLDKVQGTMVPARRFTHVDPILIERVRQYQQYAGLKPDGTAGPQTLLHLAIDAGIINKTLSPAGS